MGGARRLVIDDEGENSNNNNNSKAEAGPIRFRVTRAKNTPYSRTIVEGEELEWTKKDGSIIGRIKSIVNWLIPSWFSPTNKQSKTPKRLSLIQKNLTSGIPGEEDYKGLEGEQTCLERIEHATSGEEYCRHRHYSTSFNHKEAPNNLTCKNAVLNVENENNSIAILRRLTIDREGQLRRLTYSDLTAFFNSKGETLLTFEEYEQLALIIQGQAGVSFGRPRKTLLVDTPSGRGGEEASSSSWNINQVSRNLHQQTPLGNNKEEVEKFIMPKETVERGVEMEDLDMIQEKFKVPEKKAQYRKSRVFSARFEDNLEEIDRDFLENLAKSAPARPRASENRIKLAEEAKRRVAEQIRLFQQREKLEKSQLEQSTTQSQSQSQSQPAIVLSSTLDSEKKENPEMKPSFSFTIPSNTIIRPSQDEALVSSSVEDHKPKLLFDFGTVEAPTFGNNKQQGQTTKFGLSPIEEKSESSLRKVDDSNPPPLFKFGTTDSNVPTMVNQSTTPIFSFGSSDQKANSRVDDLKSLTNDHPSSETQNSKVTSLFNFGSQTREQTNSNNTTEPLKNTTEPQNNTTFSFGSEGKRPHQDTFTRSAFIPPSKESISGSQVSGSKFTFGIEEKKPEPAKQTFGFESQLNSTTGPATFGFSFGNSNAGGVNNSNNSGGGGPNSFSFESGKELSKSTLQFGTSTIKEPVKQESFTFGRESSGGGNDTNTKPMAPFTFGSGNSTVENKSTGFNFKFGPTPMETTKSSMALIEGERAAPSFSSFNLVPPSRPNVSSMGFEHETQNEAKRLNFGGRGGIQPQTSNSTSSIPPVFGSNMVQIPQQQQQQQQQPFPFSMGGTNFESKPFSFGTSTSHDLPSNNYMVDSGNSMNAEPSSSVAATPTTTTTPSTLFSFGAAPVGNNNAAHAAIAPGGGPLTFNFGGGSGGTNTNNPAPFTFNASSTVNTPGGFNAGPATAPPKDSSRPRSMPLTRRRK